MPARCTRAAEGQDVVYHVAGVVAARNEAEFLRANRDGTANVAGGEHAGRAHRASSWSRPGGGGPVASGQAAARRSEPPRPVTAYGRSKLAAEQVVTASAAPLDHRAAPHGLRPRDREVLKVFRMARLGVAPVFGDGSQELSAVHGADLAEALGRGGDLRRDDRPDVLSLPSRSCHQRRTRPRRRRRHGAAGRHRRRSGAGRASAPRADGGRRPPDRSRDNPHDRQGSTSSSRRRGPVIPRHCRATPDGVPRMT